MVMYNIHTCRCSIEDILGINMDIINDIGTINIYIDYIRIQR